MTIGSKINVNRRLKFDSNSSQMRRSRSRSISQPPRGRMRLGSASRSRSVSRSSSRSTPRIGNMNLWRTGGRMPFDSKEQKDITLSNAITIPAFGVTTSTLTLLNGCAQGTTAATRLGRRIKMKSLYFRFISTLAPTSTQSCFGRVLIVYDKQSNATAPAATDVLLADSYGSGNNLSNSSRFVTLMDKAIPCIGTGGPQTIHFKKYIKLNHDVEFNTGSAGTIGDIQTGSVYCLVFFNATIGVAAATTTTFSRIRFVDP